MPCDCKNSFSSVTVISAAGLPKRAYAFATHGTTLQSMHLREVPPSSCATIWSESCDGLRAFWALERQSSPSLMLRVTLRVRERERAPDCAGNDDAGADIADSDSLLAMVVRTLSYLNRWQTQSTQTAHDCHSPGRANPLITITNAAATTTTTASTTATAATTIATTTTSTTTTAAAALFSISYFRSYPIDPIVDANKVKCHWAPTIKAWMGRFQGLGHPSCRP